jgi:hypothetical protein
VLRTQQSVSVCCHYKAGGPCCLVRKVLCSIMKYNTSMSLSMDNTVHGSCLAVNVDLMGKRNGHDNKPIIDNLYTIKFY